MHEGIASLDVGLLCWVGCVCSRTVDAATRGVYLGTDGTTHFNVFAGLVFEKSTNEDIVLTNLGTQVDTGLFADGSSPLDCEMAGIVSVLTAEDCI